MVQGKDEKDEKTNDRSAGRDTGGRDTESEDANLRARLSKLRNALDRRQPSETGDDASLNQSSQSLGAATNLGLRALVEFVSAVVVAPLIGWQIDTWFNTGPIFLFIFLIAGMAAGFLNVYRLGVGPKGQGEDKK